MKAAGIQMRHLPTNGGGPALTALLGNNSQVLVSSIAAANAPDQGRQGCARWRASARSARRRCPTCRRMKELGYDVEFSLWVGLFAPKGTPDADRRQAARGQPRRRPPPTSSRQAIDNIGDVVAYLDQPDSPSSGTRTPSASRTRCTPIGKV